ncbi:Lacal_2735 family protein [Algoriphagus sp. PAP.12]|uniref:Lacal_2735 family protein n=1 Tax=Algoriphagus sp. PAP.12 TaxID=2996678 RepID=UPI00227AA35F|nr:Lacal_2735 family protein [Algoriphagus sp. PAP.12]
MFNLFKKKSELEKLEVQYKKLLDESYKLSHINRKQSDQKSAEANEILNRIEKIKKGTN